MDETIYVILKVLFDFALEVWFSIYIYILWTNASLVVRPCFVHLYFETDVEIM